jgi:short-subunit dehydrogenase
VNNAGVSVGATFADHSLEDFEWLMGVNFWGVVYGCKLFLPQLLDADEAHIVNISSVFGLQGVPMNAAYCASKFAVRGLSESLRAELAETHVGVTCVHPGGVATNIVRDARFVEPEGMRGMQQRTIETFKKMLPPARAAEDILRGIKRNSARVMVTREAYAIDWVKRAFPDLATRLVAKNWKKLDF